MLESMQKRLWPILKYYTHIYVGKQYYSHIYLGEQRKSTKYINHDIQSTDYESQTECVKCEVVTQL